MEGVYINSHQVIEEVAITFLETTAMDVDGATTNPAQVALSLKCEE